MDPTRALRIPATLAVVALAVTSASGCPDPGPADVVTDSAPDAVSDATDDVASDATRCGDVRDSTGALLYTVCPSQVNADCARLIYPDGGVNDPTLC